jgi:hypothetical protein
MDMHAATELLEVLVLYNLTRLAVDSQGWPMVANEWTVMAHWSNEIIVRQLQASSHTLRM